MNVTIEEEDRQMILLALAELSLRRPGWLDALGRVADTFQGREMFDGFRETSADLVRPSFESNAREPGEIPIGPTPRPEDADR